MPKIRDEFAVLEIYMPKQLTEDELNEIVTQTISQVGATSKADMGKVMGALKKRANHDSYLREADE